MHNLLPMEITGNFSLSAKQTELCKKIKDKKLNIGNIEENQHSLVFFPATNTLFWL